MRIKICGLRKLDQAQAIARLGVNSLGFICFPPSPRYIDVPQLKEIVHSINTEIAKIGVFVNPSKEHITKVVQETGLTGVQLHGEEPPEFCYQLRQSLSSIELIKVIRVKNLESLLESEKYFTCVDTLLLDAYHPQFYGGTGETLNWEKLAQFRPPIPWLLAGGLTPDNIVTAIKKANPDGVDLSSGVERSPGDKDLAKVVQLLSLINNEQ
jgi:phosphoribosylanthranilate isomerase